MALSDVKVTIDYEVIGNKLFEQLVTWQKRGLIPELHSVGNDKWVLLLSTDHWSVRSDFDEHDRRMRLKFVTDPCDTPQDAIRAAMEMIR